MCHYYDFVILKFKKYVFLNIKVAVKNNIFLIPYVEKELDARI